MRASKVVWNEEFLSQTPGASDVIRRETMRIAEAIEDEAARASRWDRDSGLTDPRQQSGYRAEQGKGMAAIVTVLNPTKKRTDRLKRAARKGAK